MEYFENGNSDKNKPEFILNKVNLKEHWDVIRMISNFMIEKCIVDLKLSEEKNERLKGKHFVEYYPWVHNFDYAQTYMDLRRSRNPSFKDANTSLAQYGSDTFLKDHAKAIKHLARMNKLDENILENAPVFDAKTINDKIRNNKINNNNNNNNNNE